MKICDYFIPKETPKEEKISQSFFKHKIIKVKTRIFQFFLLLLLKMREDTACGVPRIKHFQQLDPFCFEILPLESGIYH